MEAANAKPCAEEQQQYDQRHKGDLVGGDQVLEQGAAADLDHALGLFAGELAQRLPARGGEHDGGAPRLGGQVAALGGLQLVIADQAEDVLHRGDTPLDLAQGLVLMDTRGGLAHGGERGAQQVVGPDHGGDARLAEQVGGRGVVHGGHDHHRRAALETRAEIEDLARVGLLGMDQHRIRPGVDIGVGAVQGLFHGPA